ncbi:hypothetical protein CLOM_g3010, partial [Closterium sp. NIES-68]
LYPHALGSLSPRLPSSRVFKAGAVKNGWLVQSLSATFFSALTYMALASCTSYQLPFRCCLGARHAALCPRPSSR